MEPVIRSAAAIVPVRDVAASLAFYTDVLGFERHFVREDMAFAIVGRGPAWVHLQSTDDEEALRATATQIAMYVTVKGLDALHEQLEPRLRHLPEGRHRPPFTQDYGMREFHVKDPDGFLLFFGEEA